MDSDEETLLFALLIRRRLRRRKRCWVSPIVASRLMTGHFNTLYPELRSNSKQFKNYFRMSLSTFDVLLNILKSQLEHKDTVLRKSISAEERLAITIRFLASGCTFTELHYSYKCGISTVSSIVRETCLTIWNSLKFICMPPTSEEEWLKIAKGFNSTTNFPNLLGAIDGKHIEVFQPAHSGSLYFNYKHYFSLVLLAVCDSDFNFIFIDVGSYGKSADSQIYKNSTLYKMINEKSLNIPKARPLHSSGEPLPFTFIGDEAFGLEENMQRPYSGNNLPPKQRIYNYRLSRARRNIECAFGILANTWRILHRPLNMSIDLCEDIVKSCCVLHNFVRQRENNYISPTTNDTQDTVGNPIPSTRNKTAYDIRDNFADYFVSDAGALPWQSKYA